MNVFKLNEYIDAFLNIVLIYISPIDIREKRAMLFNAFIQQVLTFNFSVF